MKPPPRPRAHLVERAVMASGLDLPAPPGAPAAPAPPPATAPVAPPPKVPPPAQQAPPAAAAVSSPRQPQAFTPAQQPSSPPAPTPSPPLTSSPAQQPSMMAAPVSAAQHPMASVPMQQPRPASLPATAPVIPLPVLVAAGLVASPGGSARPRVAEEMNLVQQQVLRGVEELSCERGRVVLITSARPGEGKTFVALNLAAAMAANGQRPVVLVDADGRQGALSDVLGASAMPGLWGLAQPSPRRTPPLLPTAVERLFFMPHGGVPGGSGAGLPTGTALAEAVTRLARSLPDHLLVLDTPPSLSTSNAHALAAHTGQVVMVVAAEGTRNEEVEAALDMMEACPRLQLLLNRVRLNVKGGFGAGDGKGGTRAA